MRAEFRVEKSKGAFSQQSQEDTCVLEIFVYLLQDAQVFTHFSTVVEEHTVWNEPVVVKGTQIKKNG
jgi:hypothetical protein